MVIGGWFIYGCKFINPTCKAIYKGEIDAILKVQPHLYMVYQVLGGSTPGLVSG